MARTASDLTPEEREQYFQHARDQRIAKRAALVERHQRGWALAYACRDMLRKRFGAHRVVVYGSLLDEQRFTEFSDVDMAAWGIPSDQSFSAMGEVWAMGMTHGIEVSLADPAMCHSELLQSILRDGVDI